MFNVENWAAPGGHLGFFLPLAYKGKFHLGRKATGSFRVHIAHTAF